MEASNSCAATSKVVQSAGVAVDTVIYAAEVVGRAIGVAQQTCDKANHAARDVLWEDAMITDFDANTNQHTVVYTQKKVTQQLCLSPPLKFRWNHEAPACQPPNPSFATAPQGEAAVGRRVRVYWPGNAKWYQGVVRCYDKVSDTHTIDYKDGDTLDHCLKHEAVQFITDISSPNKQSAAKAEKGTAGSQGLSARAHASAVPASPTSKHTQPISSNRSTRTDVPLFSLATASPTELQAASRIMPMSVTRVRRPSVGADSKVLPVSGLKRASKDPPEEQSSGASAASPLPSALLPPLSASLPPPHPTPTPKPAAAPSKDVGGAGRPSVLKKRRLAAPPPQPPAGGPTRQMCVMAVGTRVEVMWRPGGGHYRGRLLDAHPTVVGRFRIRFDDGQVEWTMLAGAKDPWRWLGPRAGSAGWTQALHAAMSTLGAANVAPVPAGEHPSLTAPGTLDAPWMTEVREPPPHAPQDGVGRRLHVYWRADGQWYPGEVLAYSRDSGMHHVLYDDGEDEWVRLGSEHVVWTGHLPRQSQHPVGLRPGTTAPTKGAAVGWRVAVYWKDDQTLYEGRIIDYDRVSGKHEVRYDDGDAEEVYLARERVVWRLKVDAQGSESSSSGSSEGEDESDSEDEASDGAGTTEGEESEADVEAECDDDPELRLLRRQASGLGGQHAHDRRDSHHAPALPSCEWEAPRSMLEQPSTAAITSRAAAAPSLPPSLLASHQLCVPSPASQGAPLALQEFDEVREVDEDTHARHKRFVKPDTCYDQGSSGGRHSTYHPAVATLLPAAQSMLSCWALYHAGLCQQGGQRNVLIPLDTNNDQSGAPGCNSKGSCQAGSRMGTCRQEDCQAVRLHQLRTTLIDHLCRRRLLLQAIGQQVVSVEQRVFGCSMPIVYPSDFGAPNFRVRNTPHGSGALNAPAMALTPMGRQLCSVPQPQPSPGPPLPPKPATLPGQVAVARPPNVLRMSAGPSPVLNLPPLKRASGSGEAPTSAPCLPALSTWGGSPALTPMRAPMHPAANGPMHTVAAATGQPCANTPGCASGNGTPEPLSWPVQASGCVGTPLYGSAKMGGEHRHSSATMSTLTTYTPDLSAGLLSMSDGQGGACQGGAGSPDTVAYGSSPSPSPGAVCQALMGQLQLATGMYKDAAGAEERIVSSAVE